MQHEYEIEYQYTKNGVGSTDNNGAIRFEAKNDRDAKGKVKLLLDREKELKHYSSIWHWELKRIICKG